MNESLHELIDTQTPIKRSESDKYPSNNNPSLLCTKATKSSALISTRGQWSTTKGLGLSNLKSDVKKSPFLQAENFLSATHKTIAQVTWHSFLPKTSLKEEEEKTKKANSLLSWLSEESLNSSSMSEGNLLDLHPEYEWPKRARMQLELERMKMLSCLFESSITPSDEEEEENCTQRDNIGEREERVKRVCGAEADFVFTIPSVPHSRKTSSFVSFIRIIDPPKWKTQTKTFQELQRAVPRPSETLTVPGASPPSFHCLKNTQKLSKTNNSILAKTCFFCEKTIYNNQPLSCFRICEHYMHEECLEEIVGRNYMQIFCPLCQSFK